MAHSSYVQLDLDDRRRLYRLRSANTPVPEIARIMGRHRSTIYRELGRNTFEDDEVPQASGYSPVIAHDMALSRRRRLRKLIRLPELLTAVIEGLRLGWSPEQIAGRLRHDDAPRCVRHETIYQFAYSKEGRALELSRLLPEGRRRRRPRGGRRARDMQAVDARSVKLRPEVVARREEFGHWEGDLLMFRKVFGKANVISLVERTSRYAVLLRNNDRQSEPIMSAVIDGFAPLPVEARRSFTIDRGTEFAAWAELKRGLGADAWFCDPKAPWQKGSVENANRRIRRWLPRDVDPLALTRRDLHAVSERLNATPRKCLGFRTPTEAFRAVLAEERC